MKTIKRFMMAAFAVGVIAATDAGTYQVSVGTYVVNGGKTVTVPVALSNAAGLSYASARLSYDPQVLVVTKVEPGSLRSVMSEDFVSADTNGTVSVAIFGSTSANVESGSGSIAEVTFAVRTGTDGLYSDIAVTDVELGERTGVKDVTVESPLTTVNGMVRVVPADAAVTRLESAQIVCADTRLGALTLADGDAIQASDSQTAIQVAGEVVSSGTVPVAAPVNGWANGRYALISTPTAALSFMLSNLADGTTVAYSSEILNGITTYYAQVSVAGSKDVVAVDPDDPLDAGSRNQICANAQRVFEGKTDAASGALRALYESATRIEVTGPKGQIALIADMGISPAFAPALDESGTLRLTYAMPKLEIIDFNAQNGAVRFKVTPGEGNEIVSSIATGYIHVYGTDDLKERMRRIASVGFDLSPYLKTETKGEGVLNVTMGTHTFLRIKIEKGE